MYTFYRRNHGNFIEHYKNKNNNSITTQNTLKMDEKTSHAVDIKTERFEDNSPKAAKAANTEHQIVANSKNTRQKGFNVKRERRSRKPLQKCQICNKSVRNMGQHMRSAHSKEKVPSVCDICQKSFSNNAKLKIHKKSHDRILQSCPVCQKNVRCLNEHIKYNHRSDEQPRICNICQKSFRNNEKLKHHMKNHSSTQKCEICQKTVRHLDQHMKYNHSSDNQKLPAENEQQNVNTRNRRRGI